MDYVKPQDIAGSMVAAGASKVNLPIKHLLIRGALAGAYLAVATSMAVGAGSRPVSRSSARWSSRSVCVWSFCSALN